MLGGPQSRSVRRGEDGNSNSEPSVVQPVASRYTDYAILATRLIYFLIPHKIVLMLTRPQFNVDKTMKVNVAFYDLIAERFLATSDV
jgi:hypothetical protein